jgi:ABC-2 type transport system permease protein
MSALVGAELLKLRLTRTAWVLLAVVVLLSGLRVTMVLASAGTASGIRAGTTDAALTLVGAAATGTVVAVFLGILSVTWEHQHQTLTGTLLGTPDRRRVVVAKAIALAAVGALTGLGLSLAGACVAVVSGYAGGVGAGTWLSMVVGVTVSGAFWAWFGVGIGLVVRNQTAALLVPLVWFLVVEPMAGAYGLHGLVPWLPGSLPGALVGANGPATPPVWAALATLIGYGLLLTVPGARRLTLQDVT